MLRRFAGFIGAAVVVGLTWILPAFLSTWEEWTGDLMGPMLLLFGAGGATHLVAWSLTEEHHAHVRVTTAAHILVGMWLYVMTVSLTGLEGPAGWLAVVLGPSALALLWWISRSPERPDLRTVDGQVVFRFSRRKLLFVLASLLIGEVSAVVWLWALGTGAISDPIPQLAGVRLLLPPVVVAVTVMVAWVASRILNPVALAIDAEGIIDRTSLLGYGRLTWEVVTLSPAPLSHGLSGHESGVVTCDTPLPRRVARVPRELCGRCRPSPADAANPVMGLDRQVRVAFVESPRGITSQWCCEIRREHSAACRDQ